MQKKMTNIFITCRIIGRINHLKASFMLFFYDHLKEKAEKLITEGKINANTAFKFC